MTLSDLQLRYAQHPQVSALTRWADFAELNLKITGLNGSACALVATSLFKLRPHTQVIVMNDADEAGYLYNDMKQILSPEEVFYFPSSYKKAIKLSQLDTSNEILRTEVLNRLANSTIPCVVITYPEALMQKVVSAYSIKTHTLRLQIGESLSIDFLTEMLREYGFERVDFVYEPGQFSVRGSIVDIFSFAFEMPFRCDFFGDEVESIRVFDIETQLSKEQRTEVEIIPDLHVDKKLALVSFLEFISETSWLTFNSPSFVRERINQLYDEALVKANDGNTTPDLHKNRITGDEFMQQTIPFRKIEWAATSYFKTKAEINFNCSPQPIFHKNFDLVADNLKQGVTQGYELFILSDSVKQTDRIKSIFEDRGDNISVQPIKNTLHEGFIDHDLSIFCYTDHQIFDRFHKYQLRTDRTRLGKVVLTLKELNQFRIGDYMVHVDHGVGTFGGLVRTNVNGKMQEMVKLIYKDDDIIFVSIHSLHRISKYKGKEGEAPRINKLGTGAWERLKERT
ncbi:MAG: CarD family transcriptional regulator, partial [Paludibacter sp.]